MSKLNLAKDTNTSADVLNDIANELLKKENGTYKKSDISIFKAILFNANTQANTLEKCIFDLSYKLFFTTVQVPNETFDINKQFKDYTRLRIALRDHPHITKEIINKFDSDLSIKYIKDKDILKELSAENDPFIRTLVAQNVNTDIEVLDKLSYDENDIVRFASIKHQDITFDILERLASDDAIDIKIFVASHLDTSTKALLKLVLVGDLNLDNAIKNHHNVNDEILNIISNRKDKDFESLLGF